MPNSGRMWTTKEENSLIEEYAKKPIYVTKSDFAKQFGASIGMSCEAVRGKLGHLTRLGRLSRGVIHESTYPVYDSPLVMEGNALIMTDLEFPFHHADFINKCLDLAAAWKVDQAILGGDVLHFDSLSAWDANWIEKKDGGLDEDDENQLFEFAQGLKSAEQAALIDLIGRIGEKEQKDGASTELEITTKEMKRFEKQFSRIDWVLGNHEGRFLRTIQTALSPKELTKLLSIGEDDPRWRIAPYYYSILNSGGEKFHIEHPKNASKFSASKLCSKYLCHVIMGHSHQLNFTFDPSGRFYAIESGAGVDESRLPYAAQRHNISPQHILGAVIVRDGIPWLLHDRTDFGALAKV